MVMVGVPLPTVQQQTLWHRDIKTTTRYINPNDDNRKKAVNTPAAPFREARREISENRAEVGPGERSAGAETALLSHN